MSAPEAPVAAVPPPAPVATSATDLPSPWAGLVGKLAKLSFAVPVPLPSDVENVGGDILIGTVKGIDRGIMTIACAARINTKQGRVLSFTLQVPEMLLRAALLPEDNGPALHGIHGELRI